MTQERIVEHHIKYKEIHGYDETVCMTESKHRTLHNRLRREGLCNIPFDVLNKISMAAQGRTKKRKEYQKTSHMKRYNSKHRKINLQHINFFYTPGLHVQFHERITYNYAAGSVYYHATFRGRNGYLLPMINIEDVELEAQARIAITAPETKEDIQDAEYEFYPVTVKEAGK